MAGVSLELELRRIQREQLLAPVKRWRPETRRELLQAIDRGLVTVDEARKAHNLSVAELLEWRSRERARRRKRA